MRRNLIKMKKVYILIFATTILLVLGCNKSEKPELLKDFSMNQYIDSYFTSPKDFDVFSKIKCQKFLSNLYQKNENQPFWFDSDNQPNAQSEDILNLLANSMNYGLDTTLYNLPTIREFTHNFPQDTVITTENKQAMLGYELCLTQSVITFFQHLHRGVMPFNPSEYITKEEIDSTSSYFTIYNYFEEFPQDSLVNILYNAFKNNSIKAAMDTVQPQNIHYKRLQKALEDYVLNNPINHDSIKVSYFEKDSVWTSTFENYRKACLALQKLRWSNITDNQYIFINIPSFSLDLVQKNRMALQHKIICGTEENQTPELNSRLRQIRLFPDWNVPYSIATKETLPMVRRNTAYMAKNHYEVLDSKGNILNPDSVPWKKYTEKYFPVKIRQTPGYHNSLGVIMFYFENLSSVYFHDTPAKGLFNKAFRAFSHGCMRLQNPITFGKAIMEFDNDILSLPKEDLVEMGIFEAQKQKKKKYDDDNEKNEKSEQFIFNKKLEDEEKHFYNVKKRISIYIRYLTAFCNEKGELCFAPDFYGRDKLLLEKYNEKCKIKN